MRIGLGLEIEECPECNSNNIINNPSTSEVYCGDCGLVIRNFDFQTSYEEECRVKENSGEVFSYGSYDDNLQTYVGEKEDIVSDEHRKLKSLNRSLRYSDVKHSKTDGIVKIGRIVSILSLPDLVKDNSIIVYSRLNKDGFCRGRTIDGVVSAAVYWSCRQLRIPRRMKEISKHTEVSVSRIKKLYHDICHELETGHLPFTAQEYLSRYLNDLGINGSCRKEAMSIVGKFKKEFNGKSPRAVAGGIIRFVIDDVYDISYKKISLTVGISSGQVRQKAHKIRSLLNS